VKRWLPTFEIFNTCICEPGFEMEATTLSIRWFGFVVEFTIGRQEGCDHG